jgi:iron complex outermembrane receptor protein
MSIRFTRTACAVALSIVFQPGFAASDDEAAVVVTATRIPYPEAEATYAAEVHTHAMIQRSGAQTLADYLGQHSSLTVMSYYGNRLMPTLEMRGYGLETGNQNVVVTVDGQRLNTIDLQPQWLGTIPLASVERIEIVKGSGSVMYGDGAMAGAINIVTKPYSGLTAEVRAGNYGAASLSAAAGIERELFSLSVGADHDEFGGVAKADSTGNKDSSLLRSERMQARLRPLSGLELKLDTSSAHADTRYQNPLTLAQFNADPNQSGGLIYTHDVYDVDQWRLGAAYVINDALRLTVDHRQLDKQYQSIASWGSFGASYGTVGDDIALIYTKGDLDLSVGWQQADASRRQTTNLTSKDNSGYYLQGTYRMGDASLSFGSRRETVDYAYQPTIGATTRGSHELDAWDFGVNQRLNAHWTAFANLNKSFQAPDVDRFFTWTGAFNGLIAPSVAKTLTAGVHRVEGRGNKFKLSLFRANLNNEIYFDQIGGNNTNIDQSHKYGLEVQQYWQPNADWSLNVNYAWTKALIDRENSGAGAYDGKEMPGVSRHALNLSATYAIDDKTSLAMTHAWRSKGYAIADFDNNNAQRQAAFETTGLSLRHQRGAVEYFATINNLFEHKNGMWTGDNAIYPVNYERTMVVGAKVSY